MSDRKPHFNHIALSVPSAMLSAEGMADLTDFYGEVFGWQELPQMTEPDRRLVMMCHSYEQFVFLHANDKTPTTGAKMDHFGLSVSTEDEFVELLGKAQVRAEKDGKATQVIGPLDEWYGPLRLRQFYVSHTLPFMVEVQWFDWASVAGKAPAEGKIEIPALADL